MRDKDANEETNSDQRHQAVSLRCLFGPTLTGRATVDVLVLTAWNCEGAYRTRRFPLTLLPPLPQLSPERQGGTANACLERVGRAVLCLYLWGNS